MRTRTGRLIQRTTCPNLRTGRDGRSSSRAWRLASFVLCLAGLALAPATASAQYHDMGTPDTIYPLPTVWSGRYETGGPFVALRALVYHQTVPLRPQVIARRGLVDFDGSITADLGGQLIFPPNSPPIIFPGTQRPGTFLGSGAVALRADDVGSGTYTPGFGITAGWRFVDGVTVEVDWWRLAEAKYSAAASLVPPGLNPGPLLVDSFLFAPVFNFPIDYAGPPLKLALGNPGAAYGIWNGASLMQTEFVQRTQGIDLTVRIPVYQDDYVRCYGLIGPRFVWFWERFKWRTVSYDFSGFASDKDVATYTNIVSNRMYGAHFGVGSEWNLKYGLSFSLDLRVAPLIDVVKERARYELGDKAISAKRSKTEYEFVPELQANANLWWYTPVEGLVVRFGYDFMAFFNTISSKEPVSFNYGSLDPHWDSTIRLLDGFNAGLAFIF